MIQIYQNKGLLLSDFCIVVSFSIICPYFVYVYERIALTLFLDLR